MVVLKKKKIKKAQKKVIKPKKTVSKKVVKVKPKSSKKKVLIKRVLKKTKPKKLVLGKRKVPSLVKKFTGNPIMGPSPSSSWESEAVFNPAAVVSNGRIHLFYRALGGDGLSRIGYASSKDGIHFDERMSYPVYVAENFNDAMKHHPYTSPARLVYDTAVYSSGGGWGGCEDPRATKIDGRIYLTFNMFNGWESMRIAFTSITEEDLNDKKWNWSKFLYLSRPGDRQKNWVLFPEKFNGKFALFHNLDLGDPGRVHIAFVDELDMYKTPTQREAPDVHTLPDHIVSWHNRTRSASAPPIKTKDGWLLFYHAMDKDDPGRYKVGAMLLDLQDPTKVIYRASYPIIEPDLWYENDWKPGIVYASGAVVKDGTLFIYYGGGDKHIAVAYVSLEEFLSKLKNKENIVFSRKSIIKV
ncbi:hypothetical protein HZA26_03625 [Candidatus Nomurabacteria bacterium]|nr:hypothetical protein [Candidatus Nomurabacteria bacterium]